MNLMIRVLLKRQGVIAAGHFCSERGFSSVIQELAKRLVPCTRRLWQLTKVIFFTSHDLRECAIFRLFFPFFSS